MPQHRYGSTVQRTPASVLISSCQRLRLKVYAIRLSARSSLGEWPGQFIEFTGGAIAADDAGWPKPPGTWSRSRRQIGRATREL
jgi:hypothetical protein